MGLKGSLEVWSGLLSGVFWAEERARVHGREPARE